MRRDLRRPVTPRRAALAATATIVIAVVAALAPTSTVSGAPTSDPAARRLVVRAERARTASRIDTSTASLAQVDAALAAINENRRVQEAALTQADRAVRTADRQVRSHEAEIVRLDQRLTVLQAEMRRRAVDAYIRPREGELSAVLGSEDLTASSTRSFYLELQASTDAAVADDVQATTSDLRYERKAAERRRDQAARERTRVRRQVDAVHAAEAHQQRIATDLQATIDRQVERSLELASTDRELAGEIARQQAALQARLLVQRTVAAKAAADSTLRQVEPPVRPTPELSVTGPRSTPPPSSTPSPSTAAPAPSTTAPRSPGRTPSPTQPSPVSPPTTRPPIVVPPPPPPSGGAVRICNAGGIQVNCSLAPRLNALLAAARASGVPLSGSGYRDPSGQIRVRMNNCGTSYYAIYQMPASACRPPTAKPGTSQHELGLAVDFGNCQSRSTRCYQWLRANAARFGMYNLPVEPWHWSTTGN